jgi:hypothetical protein
MVSASIRVSRWGNRVKSIRNHIAQPADALRVAAALCRTLAPGFLDVLAELFVRNLRKRPEELTDLECLATGRLAPKVDREESRSVVARVRAFFLKWVFFPLGLLPVAVSNYP